MITEALVVARPGAPFKLQTIKVEEHLRSNELLIKIRATGICHTDLNFSKEDTIPGLFPAVFGHEGAGTVVAIGSSVNSISIGDNVIISYTSCGDCSNCKSHHTSFCRDWEQDNFGVGRHDGSKAYSLPDGQEITSHFFGQSSMARHCIASERSVVKVSGDEPLEFLAPLGCGIMTGAGAMLNVVKPNASSTVVIAGAGAVGLAAIMAAKLSPEPPKKLIAVDIVPSRLDLAKGYGATDVFNSAQVEDLNQALLDLTDGEGISAAIDCTGRPDVINTLIESTGKRGVVVTVGVGKLDAMASANIFKTVNYGRTYTGCCMGNCYPQEFIPKLIKAAKRGDFPFMELVKVYPVQDVDAAIKDTTNGSVVKAVISWE